MRHADSYEKVEFAGLSRQEQLDAAAGGRKRLEAIKAGVVAIARGFVPSADIANTEKAVIDLVTEALRTRDGSKLRLLADVAETLGQPFVDPVRAYLILSDNHRPWIYTAREIRKFLRNSYPDGGTPTIKTIQRAAKELGLTLTAAPRGGARKSKR